MQPQATDSHRRHRREFIVHIVLPVVLGGGVLLAVGLVWVSGGNDVGRLADLALIWLLLPCMVLGWIPLALIVAAVVGLQRLLGLLPKSARQVQRVASRTAAQIEKVADRAAAPLISTSAKAAALRRFFQFLWRG